MANTGMVLEIDKGNYTTEEFERKLFIVRKKCEIAVRN